MAKTLELPEQKVILHGISWETYEQLLADRSSFEDYDIDRARTQGYAFAALQRLAIEHLLRVR